MEEEESLTSETNGKRSRIVCSFIVDQPQHIKGRNVSPEVLQLPVAVVHGYIGDECRLSVLTHPIWLPLIAGKVGLAVCLVVFSMALLAILRAVLFIVSPSIAVSNRANIH
jgi:hypothetical protein